MCPVRTVTYVSGRSLLLVSEANLEKLRPVGVGRAGLVPIPFGPPSIPTAYAHRA